MAHGVFFWREEAPDFWRGILFCSNVFGCVVRKSILGAFVWARAFVSLCLLPCVDSVGYLANEVLLLVPRSLEIKVGEDRYT